MEEKQGIGSIRAGYVNGTLAVIFVLRIVILYFRFGACM
jgi:hypothetical protein